MRRTAAFLFLSCMFALLLPELAAADKIARKSHERRFPSGWCPLPAEDVLEFKATGSSATIRFVADPKHEQAIDNIYVVEKALFQQSLINDDTCDDAGDWGPFFNPLITRGGFLETFNADANGWKLNKSSWREDTGALYLQTNGLGGVIVSGLKKGRTYVVGASWFTDDQNTEGAVLTLKVDTKGQLGCGPEGLAAGDLLLPEDE